MRNQNKMTLYSAISEKMSNFAPQFIITMAKLPENAFRELKEGEDYKPMLSPDQEHPEVNAWSVVWGLIMAVVFSAAAAYLGLKVGQVFEAAIPIAIIAVGLSSATKRKGALGENVIIQSIGECSGAIVSGAIFTLPAIYILQAKYPEMVASFWQIFVASCIGGVLGILFLIPFRKFFVKDQHGKYPFPEATATTQVLVTGEDDSEGGSQARPLLVAGLVGGLYDFIVSSFGWWNEEFTTRVLPWGEQIADKAKLVFKVNTGAAVLGLGYIVGLKYAFIICLGSFAVWWLIVPLMSLFCGDMVINDWNPSITQAVGQMSPEQIFTNYGKSIGIGGIAMAGIIGIVKSWSIITGAVSLAAREIKGGNADSEKVERTQRDMPFRTVTALIVLFSILLFIFLFMGVMAQNWLFTIVAMVLVLGIAFLFTTVAANATAMVGTNPVSGMTLMTLIIASVVLAGLGLHGTSGMLAALLMGSVTCTALAMAGCFVTDLKIGYWIGSTPIKQQQWKFLGTVVSAATVAGVMMLLNETYGFTSGQFAAPQANAMAAVIEPLMNGDGAPWMLYGIGAAIALILTWLKIPALAFALGMFIPLELNVPILIGGAINWFVTTRTSDENVNKQRGEKGTLIASGFIAGGALMGVVSALLRSARYDFVNAAWLENGLSQYVSLLAYVMLIAYFIKATRKN